MRVTCTVNGEPHQADDVWAGESLLYVLRERMGLPGSKNACEQGECGSCTVYLDGVPACACLVAAGQAEGCDVRTVEGLAKKSANPRFAYSYMCMLAHALGKGEVLFCPEPYVAATAVSVGADSRDSAGGKADGRADGSADGPPGRAPVAIRPRRSVPRSCASSW